jgi:hypothetical protein
MNHKDNYIKIKIVGLFDLEVLAKKYRINASDLRNFHNQHCSFQEIIPNTLINYIPYIYLPIPVYNTWKERQLPEKGIKAPSINYSKKYGVLINFTPKDLSIHYELSINKNNLYTEIIKYKSFFNNDEADLLVEQFIQQASNTLYPLKLILNDNGEINTIFNDAEIKTRWEQAIKPSLNTYYKSDVSINILNKVDYIFSDINNNISLLSNNLFFKVFFSSIYLEYNDYKKHKTLDFYIPSIKENIEFNCLMSLNKEYSFQNKIILSIEGTNIDKNGELSIIYKLNRDSNTIYSIVGEVSIYNKEQNFKIEFEIFELK